jgi:hypothetical protein
MKFWLTAYKILTSLDENANPSKIKFRPRLDLFFLNYSPASVQGPITGQQNVRVM